MPGRYRPRTCSVVGDVEEKHHPLDAFRDRDAFVLLAAPGAGKTGAFEHEARVVQGCYVTARNFLALPVRPEWRETTLFIDGLDERRAGSSDQRTPLDEVRAKLHALGKPRFRLSCREADWFGANDRSHLAMVAPGGEVTELRLDPLTDEDILELLHQLGVEDPQVFVADARDQGLHALMGNPQGLEMLARSVAGGREWPTTRLETFERSCRELAKELNRDHQLAGQPKVDTAELLDAAGELCAVYLLTGAAGYAEFEGDSDLLPLSGFRTPDQEVLKVVCRTSLFGKHNLSFAPRHRQIAEFLGGRYLAGLVAVGLPVGRVLALLTGFDGGIVSELRGLAAWWAAHDPEAKPDIIERDPLGVVLYGDVKGFSVAEKEAVIDGLERIAERDPTNLTRFRETDVRWGDLATEEMAPSFSRRLSDRDGGEAQQAVQIALLESLARGSRVPGMVLLLLDSIRDPRRPLRIREMSLSAYLKQNADKQEEIALLEAIKEGSLRDPHDRLRGELLHHLYPDGLSPRQLATYFAEPKNDGAGWITHFWLTYVPRESTPEQLAELMDALANAGKLRKAADQCDRKHYLFRNIPRRLLSKLLSGNQPDADRLFEWLGFVDPSDHVDGRDEIRRWFGNHPETFKAVFKISAERESDPDGLYSVRQLLIALGPPEDLGMWCVAEANSASGDEVSLRFAREAAVWLGSTPDWNEVDRNLAQRPQLRALIEHEWKEQRYRHESPTRGRREYADDQRREQRKAWHDGVAEHVEALEANEANPQLLHDLADVYFGHTWHAGDGRPRERLLDLLENDIQLVDTVLRAFVSTAARDDLPTPRQILGLASAHRSHYLSLAFLAGLEERDEPLDESLTRLGLAILFNDPGLDEDPQWYGTLVEERPAIVAEMLVKSARRAFRTSREDSSGLYRLSSADHAAVADHALLPALKAFPTRSTSKRLPLLAFLIEVGLVRYPIELAQLVRDKLRSNSMDVAQRMYWLCAGVLSGHGEFEGRLGAALEGGGERRARHVASFFRQVDAHRPMVTIGPNAIAMLIRSVGSTYRPVRLGPGAHWVTPAAEAAELVHRCIGRLAGMPMPEASDYLEELASNTALAPWIRELRHAQTTQLEARRNAMFRHGALQEILDTLDGGNPFNAPDLAALVVDVLAKLAKEIRNGETSDWRQYWKTGIEEPEHEDTCRDRLLSDLKRELKHFTIRAEPEGRYADAKRADIKVVGGGAALPIEIKKSVHRGLWTAIRSQLMAKYSRDPLAEGHGIYLVLWFGQTFCHPRPDGRRPEGAEQLRNALQADLSPGELRKVSVCVVDVAKRG